MPRLISMGLLLAIACAGSASGQENNERSVTPPQYFAPLSGISADISLPGEGPQDGSGDVFSPPQLVSGGARPAAETHVQWAAPNLHHQPLYFQELMLERHGLTANRHLQPLFSGAHFFAVAFTMPYRVGVDRPCDIEYVYGQGRPGSPAPCVRQGLPLSWQGAALQGVAVAGGVLMFP